MIGFVLKQSLEGFAAARGSCHCDVLGVSLCLSGRASLRVDVGDTPSAMVGMGDARRLDGGAYQAAAALQVVHSGVLEPSTTCFAGACHTQRESPVARNQLGKFAVFGSVTTGRSVS